MATLNSLPGDAMCNVIIHLDDKSAIGKLAGTECTRFDNSYRVGTHLTWIYDDKRVSGAWITFVRQIYAAFPVLTAAGRLTVESGSQSDDAS